jgi:hypothetical protein
MGGGRVLVIHSTTGSFVLVLNRGESHLLTLVRSTDEPSGDYGRALVTFDAGGLPWDGTTILRFPHWAVAAVTAAWPAVRFARRRRRARAASFPVEPPAAIQ